MTLRAKSASKVPRTRCQRIGEWILGDRDKISCVFLFFCLSVCLSDVRALNEKRLELSTPNLVHIIILYSSRSTCVDPDVKGQRSRSHAYENRHGRTVAATAVCSCCRRGSACRYDCLFSSYIPAASSRTERATWMIVWGRTRQQSERTTNTHSVNALQAVVAHDDTIRTRTSLNQPDSHSEHTRFINVLIKHVLCFYSWTFFVSFLKGYAIFIWIISRQWRYISVVLKRLNYKYILKLTDNQTAFTVNNNHRNCYFVIST